MDINDLPKTITVTTSTGVCLKFTKTPYVWCTCRTKCVPKVVYNAPALTKHQLETILDISTLTLTDMGIKSEEKHPIVSATNAESIAEFVSNQLHQNGVDVLVNASSWTIEPTYGDYRNEKEVKLSLVVTP